MIEITQARAGISSAMSLSQEEHGRFSIQVKQLIKLVAALVNTEGGIAYIGVEEDGTVTGLQNVINSLYTIPDFISEIRKSFVIWYGSDYNKLISSIKVIAIEGKDIIEIVVNKRAYPLVIDNKFYYRRNNEIKEAANDALISVLDKWVEEHIVLDEDFCESEPTESFRKTVEAAVNKENQKKANAAKVEQERKQREELKALLKAQQEARLHALRESLKEERKKKALKDTENRLNSLSSKKTQNISAGNPPKTQLSASQNKSNSKVLNAPNSEVVKDVKPHKIVLLADALLPIVKSHDAERLRTHVVNGEGGRLHEYRQALEVLLEKGLSDSEYWLLIKTLFSVDPIMFALIFINSKQMAIDVDAEQTKKSVETVIGQLVKYTDKVHFAYAFADIYKDYLSSNSIRCLSDNLKYLNEFDIANRFFESAFAKESELIDAMLKFDSKASLYKLYLMIKKALSNANKNSILNNLRKIQNIIEDFDKKEDYHLAISDLIRVDCLGLSPKRLSKSQIATIKETGFKALSSISGQLRGKDQKNKVGNNTAKSQPTEVEKIDNKKYVGKQLMFTVSKSVNNYYVVEYQKIKGLLPKKYSLRPNLSSGERVELYVIKAIGDILLLSYLKRPAEEIETTPIFNIGDNVAVVFSSNGQSYSARAVSPLSFVSFQIDNMTEGINLKKKYISRITSCISFNRYRVELLHPAKE